MAAPPEVATKRGALTGKTRYEVRNVSVTRNESPMRPGTLLTHLSILALVAIVASGCGRRADPVRPSVAAAEAGQPVQPSAPDRKFILDDLLD